MRLALVEGQRREAEPGLSGKCPGCGSAMVPKCGERRVWHWAHRGNLHCDHWWERETEWHRDWKNMFPAQWQEIVHLTENGEKHIADVKTSLGRVIEFQHSYLKPEERRSREAFYGSMIWVVDGLRRTRDKRSFYEAPYARHLTSSRSLTYVVPSNQCALLQDWADSRVPVYFDLGGAQESIAWFGRPVLWRLSPNSPNGLALLSPVPVVNFVNALRQGIAVKGIRVNVVEHSVPAPVRVPHGRPLRQSRRPKSWEQYKALNHRARSRQRM